MMYLPAIVSVGFYFEKKRATATGLAVCGSGFGTFLFPPVCEWLMQVSLYFFLSFLSVFAFGCFYLFLFSVSFFPVN